MSAALHRSWPPFALIVGLLLIGLLAHRDGLFAWGGGRLQRLPGGGAALLAAALALVAVVTAVLNLDTAVVFLTPVLVLAAREQRLTVEPFLYGCVFMANASSLFLPGSNLTNLLVLGGGGSGSSFAVHMFPLAITAALVTALGVLLMFRRELAGGAPPPRPTGLRSTHIRNLRPVDDGVVVAGSAAPGPGRKSSARGEPAAGGAWPGLTVGFAATAVATVLVLVLEQPAPGVLAVGVAATAVELARRRLTAAEVRRVLGPLSLLGAFVLTVALGTLARHWNGPAELLDGAGGPETAAIAALTTPLINNLPAAALYSAHAVDHPRMLLLGLNVGPNLAVTGALSALLWFRAARQLGERPSALAFSRRGLVLAPPAIVAAFLVAGL